MSVFDNVRLPDDVEQGAQGGPSFYTSILRLSNGAEARNQNWQIAKHTYDVGYGIQTKEDFEVARTFFFARRGRFRAFRFKDWGDFEAVDELCAVVGSTRQLQVTYSNGVDYVRKITRVVAETLVVYDSAGIIDPSHYTEALGLLTFTGYAPVGNVSASFEFDVPVRFDTDQFTLTLTLFNAGSIQSLTLTEVTEDS